VDPPYFFLTYAHTPDRSWVRRLYRALSDEIIERTDWPTNVPVGFMDESGISAGEDWRVAVAGALASARVLVPLYSRRYFTRPECGKEWHAFSRRMLEHRARHNGFGSPPIVPALWTPVPTEHIPAAVQHIQADFNAVHTSYAREGLYTLIKNSSYRTPYLKVVRHLAVQIIDSAENGPLSPCGINELDLSHDAFYQSPASIPSNRRLTIMVAAPTSQRLPPDRASDVYGPTPPGWNPYHPESRRPIAEAAAYIARSLDYEPDIVSLDDGLSTRNWSSPDSGLGVVLVDPWLCLDSSFTDQIRRVDELGAGRIGAVLVWNMKDQQNNVKLDDIRKALQTKAPRVLGDPGAPAALGAVHVHTPEQFSAELPGVLDRIFNRYLSHASAPSPPGSLDARPQLFGPGDRPTPARQTGGP
jgi:FxsC-like protein